MYHALLSYKRTSSDHINVIMQNNLAEFFSCGGERQPLLRFMGFRNDLGRREEDDQVLGLWDACEQPKEYRQSKHVTTLDGVDSRLF
ncbi:hypothetical protein L484_001932 [Morus notabilis]|uniref:Uncharacterized protein n=1 Tax=Morus notabilis TaxID=981085 RepID=W9RYE5_9ROSA|nr:hypothetical protein L484_001932 [Morus notabilis]